MRENDLPAVAAVAGGADEVGDLGGVDAAVVDIESVELLGEGAALGGVVERSRIRE